MAHFYQMFLTSLEVGIFITLLKEKDTELLGTAKGSDRATTQMLITQVLHALVPTGLLCSRSKPQATITDPPLDSTFHHPFYFTRIRTCQFCALDLGWKILLTYLKGKNALGLWILVSILNIIIGTSLVAQWLRLHTSTAGDTVLIPCHGAKILHAVWCSKIQ